MGRLACAVLSSVVLIGIKAQAQPLPEDDTLVAGSYDFFAASVALEDIRLSCKESLSSVLGISSAKVTCVATVPPRREEANNRSSSSPQLPGGLPSGLQLSTYDEMTKWNVMFFVQVESVNSGSLREAVEEVATNFTVFAAEHLLSLVERQLEGGRDPQRLRETYMFSSFEVSEGGEVQDLLAELDRAQVGLVLALTLSGKPSLTVPFKGFVLTAMQLTAVSFEDAESLTDFEVPSNGGGTKLSLPASIYKDLGLDVGSEVIIVFGILGDLSQEQGSSTLVEDSLTLDFYTPDGGIYKVSSLSNPILFTLRAVQSSSICSYWDEGRAAWSEEGVFTAGKEEGLLQCGTNHLTLFGGISRGFLSAFRCSQATLLSREGFDALGSSDWATQPAAWILWSLLALALGFLLAAIVTDRRREAKWDDAHFLVVNEEQAAAAEEEEAKEADATTLTLCAQGFAMSQLVGEVLVAAFHELLSDIASSICTGAAELLHACQAITDAMCGGEGPESRVAGAAGLLMLIAGHLSARTAHRNACARLLLDHNDEFSTNPSSVGGKGEAQGGDQSTEVGQAMMVPARSVRAGERHQTLTKLSTMYGDRLNYEEERLHRWCSLPGMLWWQWIANGALGSSMVFSIGMPSSTRALLVLCDFFGAVLVATFFLEAENLAPSRTNRSECDVEGFGEKIGQLIALGLMSGLVAALPVAFLSQLHARDFIVVDKEEGKGWYKQLRVWRLKDMLLWLLGLSYMAFAIFYSCLFFANVAEEDQAGWLFMVALALLDDFFLTPLAASAVPAILALLLISIMACIQRKPKKEITGTAKMLAKASSDPSRQATASTSCKNEEEVASEAKGDEAGRDLESPVTTI